MLGASWPLGELNRFLAARPRCVPSSRSATGWRRGWPGSGSAGVVGPHHPPPGRADDHQRLHRSSGWRPTPTARSTASRPASTSSASSPASTAADLRAAWGVPADAPLVGCVSRLVPRKGQDAPARRVAVAARPPPRRVAGAGGHRAAGGRAARAARQSCATSWSPARSTGTTCPAAHAAFDVFAMPCRTRLLGTDVEGLGIVYLEAQASGVPVVAGGSGGAPETVRRGHHRHGRGRQPTPGPGGGARRPAGRPGPPRRVGRGPAATTPWPVVVGRHRRGLPRRAGAAAVALQAHGSVAPIEEGVVVAVPGDRGR